MHTIGLTVMRSQNGGYYVDVPSDSAVNQHYRVWYDDDYAEFYCECPAYQYSKPQFGSSKRCKHIDRVRDDLVNAAENSNKFNVNVNSVNTNAYIFDERPKRFAVSINDGEEKYVDLETVVWLLENLSGKITVSSV